MTTIIDSETIAKPLWTALKDSGPPLQADGQCLHVRTAGKSNVITALAVNPLNELHAAVGNSEGCVYGLSLKENRIFLLHNAQCKSITNLTFWTIASSDRVIVIFSTEKNEIGFVDWKTGRTVTNKISILGAHTKKITRIVVNHIIAPGAFMCMSSDMLTYWVERSGGDGELSFQCVAATQPTPCVVPLKMRNENTAANHKDDMHRFIDAKFHYGEADTMFTCESSGIVSLWVRQDSAEQRQGRGLGMLGTLVQDFVHQQTRSTLPFKISCCDTSAGFIVLGSAESPPCVAFLRSDTLEGISQVRLPLEKSSCAVASVAVIGEELVVTTLTDGRFIAIAARNFRISFVISTPVPSDKRFSVGGSWLMEMGGPTFGLFWSSCDVYLYHLPSSRAFYTKRCMKVNNNTILNDIPAVQNHFSTSKVTPFLRKQVTREGEAVAGGMSKSKAQALVQGRFARKELHGDYKKCASEWVDVNFVEERPDRSSAAEDLTPMMTKGSFTDTLNESSCVYNMDKLREHLRTYGVFPARYRPAIWRFAMGLPKKTKTAPQFAALARFQKHVAVDIMMRSFSLPPGKLKSRVELILSVLAQHSSVFAMAEFLPFLVFPLVQIYEDDVQSVVEFILVFFLNHGRDFFLCYPRASTPIMLYMDRLMQQECPMLFQHFLDIGAASDVWGWEVLTSFYTDLLTAPEWLQMMDHAVMMNPKWLFMFHVHYIVALKAPLLLCRNFQEVTNVLRQTHNDDVSLRDVLIAAHAHFEKSNKGSSEERNLLAQYHTFRSLLPNEYEYPTEFEHDQVVLTDTVRQLEAAQAEREAQMEEEERLNEIKRQAAETLMRNELILQQQRAQVAAKYESSAQSWLAYAELEARRQQREENENTVRRQALLRQAEQVAAIERLAEDVSLMEKQTAHFTVDQLNEQTRWEMAAQQTDNELSYIDQQSENRVTDAVCRLVSGNTFAASSMRVPVVSDPSSAVKQFDSAGERYPVATPDTNGSEASASDHFTADTRDVGEVTHQPSRQDAVSQQRNVEDDTRSPGVTSRNSTQRGGVNFGVETSREMGEDDDDEDDNPSLVDEMSSINSEIQQFSTPQMYIDPSQYSSAIPRPPSQPNPSVRSIPQQAYQRLQQQAVTASSTGSLPSRSASASYQTQSSANRGSPYFHYGEPTHNTFSENRPQSPYPSSMAQSGTNSTTVPSHIFSSPSYLGINPANAPDQHKTSSSER
ncbi:hypothetical protein ADEAN_000048400 [Angomonas deanei]|uniref:Rab-GTPase-TBC domain containing protein n=1 Tax=Angomonas deanei TaxID=59799 RepID=A0A7G2BZU0_9TRYP|nr:hypothetical protein ADEAN_000048400 [Angomonas deanei]